MKCLVICTDVMANIHHERTPKPKFILHKRG